MKEKRQNHSTIKIISVMVILLLGVMTQVNAQQAYTKYCNARYGFCVEYPVNFGMEPASYNNDGRVFYDNEGYSMRAYGSYNALDHSLETEMRENEKAFDVITYRASKNSWYVLSGYKDDKIVYLKTYISRDKRVFYHLRIKYPAKFKTEYNEIVSSASRSFTPGS